MDVHTLRRRTAFGVSFIVLVVFSGSSFAVALAPYSGSRGLGGRGFPRAPPLGANLTVISVISVKLRQSGEKGVDSW